MSKIGDLIVKLRLDGKDYQKGLRNAEAKTKGMAGQFGKIVGGIKMGWAAVGAAVVAVGSEMIKSTNKFGDAWNRTMGGAKSAFNTFKTAVMSWDFKNLRANMKDSYNAGKELADSLDSAFEVENSLKLSQVKNQSVLEAYRQDLMDTNKTIEERIKAGEKYLDFMKKQANEEIALRKKVKNATIANWLTRTGAKATTAQVEEFFMGYTGKDSSVAKKYPSLVKNYEMQNDTANGEVVNAIYGHLNALSAWEVENRRIIHSIRELKGELEGEAEVIERLPQLTKMSLPDSGAVTQGAMPSFEVDLHANDERIQKLIEDMERFQEVAAEFRDACIYGFADGMQYVTDALFGLENMNFGMLMNSLLSPLADMAIKEGEILIAQGIGVEACKKALESLNGYAAIAAGTALVAVGAAAKSGLQALATSGASGTTTSSASSSDSTTTNIASEMTIYVKGTIKGSDIVISGNNTLNNWKR